MKSNYISRIPPKLIHNYFVSSNKKLTLLYSLCGLICNSNLSMNKSRWLISPTYTQTQKRGGNCYWAKLRREQDHAPITRVPRQRNSALPESSLPNSNQSFHNKWLKWKVERAKRLARHCIIYYKCILMSYIKTVWRDGTKKKKCFQELLHVLCLQLGTWSYPSLNYNIALETSRDLQMVQGPCRR